MVNNFTRKVAEKTPTKLKLQIKLISKDIVALIKCFLVLIFASFEWKKLNILLVNNFKTSFKKGVHFSHVSIMVKILLN